MKDSVKLFLLVMVLLLPNILYGAATTMYVTPAGAGSKAGTNWATAFGYPEWEADAEGSAEAGDVYYIAGGTYTLTNSLAVSARDGTAAAPIKYIGVKSGTVNEPPVASDYAYTTDRPLIAESTYSVSLGKYYHVSNLRLTGSAAYNIYSDGNNGWCRYVNIKAENSSNGTALWTGSSGVAFGCELSSVSGTALLLGNYTTVVGCYMHDSAIGLNLNASDNHIVNCIIDTCTVGVTTTAHDANSMVNNTLYNCTTGISGVSGQENELHVNNIIDNCTTGAVWAVEEPSNYWDYNCWNNTVDVSNVTKGNNAISDDPLMTAPASGDFTLGSSSPCIDEGAQPDTNTGLTGDYRWNIGADQDDVSVTTYRRRVIIGN